MFESVFVGEGWDGFPFAGKKKKTFEKESSVMMPKSARTEKENKRVEEREMEA